MEAKQRWLAVLAPFDLEAESGAQHVNRQEEIKMAFREDRK